MQRISAIAFFAVLSKCGFHLHHCLSQASIKIKFVCPLPTDPKISRRLKRFYWKKSIVFLLVTTVHRITFHSISIETVAEKL